MLVLYLSSIPGEKPVEFYRALLISIADSLKDIDQEAKEIVTTFLGYSIQRTKTSTEGKVNLWAVSLGIKAESPSNPLTLNANADPYPEDLRHIAINYLNSARSSPRDDCYPFSDEVISLITRYAQGLPRQLNTICEKVLRQAASKGYEAIDLAAFTDVWQLIQQDYDRSLTPQLRYLLYVAHQTGNISEDIKDEDLAKLNVLTFVALLPMLKQAEDMGMLIRTEDEGGIKFLPSKLFPPPPTLE